MYVSKLRGLGWQAKIGLERGVRSVYKVAFKAVTP